MMTVGITAPGLLPGIAAAAGLGLLALALHDWLGLDALILAIVLGAGLRSLLPGIGALETGIQAAAKRPLELAVMLLGATLDSRAMLAAGPGLLAGIALLVGLSLPIGYGLGRACGLGHRLALLVACGNSICGNSAIAAAAPVLEASEQEVAAALTFTALLGIGAVLLLPLALLLPGMDELRYGVLAGLTVYAVPQVAAATALTGTLSLQMATLVKLARVTMLGPVTLVLTLWQRHETLTCGQDFMRPNRRRPHPWAWLRRACGTAPVGADIKGRNFRPLILGHRRHGVQGRGRPPLVPWFIIGFAALAGLRAGGLMPAELVAPAGEAGHLLMLLAMAALGLSIDLRGLARGGGRVALAAGLSLLALTGLALGLIALLQP